MRIEGLHLHAYGHFSEHHFNFGHTSGFHLIYGDNEAGKSTTLRALSSVLFGYPHEVVDGFRHDAKDISIGIDLVAGDGRRLSFTRKRRGKNPLFIPDGTPMDENAVNRFLGGISQETFERVFALNHLRLHLHAKALLTEGGSLGFSLVEAGSGIVGLKSILDGFKKERSDLFLPGGSKPKLNQLIGKLGNLRRESRRCMVSPAEYRKCQKQIEEIEESLRRSREDKKSSEARLRQMERISKNLPLKAEYQALSIRIQDLNDVPILPPEVTQQRILAQLDLSIAEADRIAIRSKILELESAVGGIKIDDRFLEYRTEIESLSEERAVIEKTRNDLPKRRVQREEHYRNVRSLLEEADLEGNPENLSGFLPSALKRKEVLVLADVGRKLLVQRDTILENLTRATRELEESELQLADTPIPQDTGELSRAIEARDRLGEISSEISRRTRSLAQRDNVLSGTIKGLGVSSGSPSILREMVLPSAETVGRFRDLLQGLESENAEHSSRLGRLSDEIADCEQKIAALKLTASFPTEADLHLVRQERAEGWSVIRGIFIDRQSGLDERAQSFAPDGQIASIYEKKIIQADHVADLLRDHAKESTELSLLEHRRKDLDQKKNAISDVLEKLKVRRAGILFEWEGLWPTSFSLKELPNEMLGWLKRREGALAEDMKVAEERQELLLLEEKERSAGVMLAGALKGFLKDPAEGNVDRLREKAGAILLESVQERARYERLDGVIRSLRKNKDQAEQTVSALEIRLGAWRSEWGVALKEIGLAPERSIESVSVILETMNNLNALKNQIEDLTHRIDTMQDDLSRFEQGISSLDFLVPDFCDSDPIELLGQLRMNLEASLTGRTLLNELQEQIKVLSRKEEDALEKILRSQGTLSRLAEQARCPDPSKLEEIEQMSIEKAQALRDRQMLELHILRDCKNIIVTVYEFCYAFCHGERSHCRTV
ncbi:MAG: AAA family ATPase [Leptospirales bacterium]